MKTDIIKDPEAITITRGGIIPTLEVVYYQNSERNFILVSNIDESKKIFLEGVDTPWLEVVEWFHNTKHVEVEVTTDERRYNAVVKINFKKYGE